MANRITIAILIASLHGAHGAQAQPPGRQSAGPPAVSVAEARQRDITASVEYVGRVEALDSVEIRARIEGVLEKREFQEGRIVTQGDRLFLIEQIPYQVVVDKRRADLAGAEASLRNARAVLKRTQDLQARRAVSASDLDAAKAEEGIAQAAVLQTKAALREAELHLSYTEIFSPITGRVSRASVSTGNLVGPSTEPLATVSRVDPIYVTIAVSEKDLIWARRRGIDLDNPRVEPSLTLSDGSTYEQVGVFDYLDVQVNQSTDTVLARARFANPRGLLIPGQFVRVAVRQKEQVTGLVIPQAAVQEDRDGHFVLVVDANNEVEKRRVRLGDQLESDWIVNDGIASGELVIIQGLQKVRPDMPVRPVRASEN